ncbi:YczE/YyaS/YitT family protein [Methanobrevibacter sp.]|uniref:YczE/YyaS/YitT family protein n=1 Tax=Methanobrevibacter sp. TaxID=66852 RepID=UPI00388DC283
MIKRICLFVFGLFIMSLGVAFSIKSTFGTTPISSISYSLALCAGIDIGIATVIFNAALVFIQMIVLRSRFRPKRLLQFVNCFLFGYFTDVALFIVYSLNIPDNLIVNVALIFVSIFLIALGIFIYMPADIAPLPGEGCVESVAIVTDWRFSSIKIAFDTTMVAIALLMCVFFYTNPFASVNIGTVISAFLVGFTLRQIAKLYNHITGKDINIVNN